MFATRALPRLLAGFTLCLVAALLFQYLRVPLPWMLGPLLVTAVFTIAGAPITSHRRLSQVGQWWVSVALGLYFTPEVLHLLWGYAPYALAACVLASCLGLLGTLCLIYFAKADFDTAFFGGAVGGASEMTQLAIRSGARYDWVAGIHSLRLMIVIVLVPNMMLLFDVHGSDVFTPVQKSVSPAGLAWLLVSTACTGWVFTRLKVGAAWVMGPLLCASVLAATQSQGSAMPHGLINAAQLLLGWGLGSRFQPAFLRTAPRLLITTAAMTVMMLIVAALSAWGLSAVSGIHLATLVLATTPGGVSEMSITAKTLQLGVPIVTALHVLRFVYVILTCATLHAWLKPRWRYKPYG